MERNNLITEKYRMTFDYHTHTVYSHHNHGKGTIEENVQAAVKAGLSGLAVTDHGPGHRFYGVRREDFPLMRREIDRLKEIYPQLKLYLGVEANIVSGGHCLDVNKEDLRYFDFILGGYHYGIPGGYCIGNWLDAHRAAPKAFGRRLLIKNTDMAVKAVYENDLRILTHPGDKGRFDIGELARACADTDTWMEISTWHAHLTTEEIRICAREDVKFVISSDAHTPDRVGSFEGGLQRALAAGLDIERIVNIEEC